MIFDSREHAARELAQALHSYADKNPLVLAVPRGAVPMGKIVAEELKGELDIVLVRKLGAPGNPELAVGAVDESGWTYLNDHALASGADQAYLEQETQRQLETMRWRRALYTPTRSPIDPEGRIVIVVDDGLATGSTMIAALHALRAKQPQRLICAVPVASQSAYARVKPYADEIVCLETPELFYAVGQFYRHFPQVDDLEVVSLLER